MASIRRSTIVSILFTVFGGPGFVLVYVPYWITRFRIPAGEASWRAGTAGGLIGVGLLPLFESILRFVLAGRGTLMPAVPTERLVVGGLYRFVRNPMYAGVLIALGGEAILFGTWSIAVYCAAVWAIGHLFVMSYEEPTLARRYGEEYSIYKRNVPRWLPRITPWNGEENGRPD